MTLLQGDNISVLFLRTVYKTQMYTDILQALPRFEWIGCHFLRPGLGGVKVKYFIRISQKSSTLHNKSLIKGFIYDFCNYLII